MLTDKTKQQILIQVEKLYNMFKNGELGGEVMPEDSNPNLNKSSNENLLYFTLPMALNYQRNSYTLWQSALETYLDHTTNFVFNVNKVLSASTQQVREALTKHKVALQPIKQTEIWIKLCKTIKTLFNGDLRKLFELNNYDVNKIRNFVQVTHKKEFPYLSGTKICNYWLFVVSQYTNIKYCNISNLTVAPDTHVVKATKQLGLITEEEFNKSNVQEIVISSWNELLKNTKFSPINLHTPLWLWSRNGFKEIK